MKFILGLGHGEQDKWLIRHNAGYQVLDWFCQKYELDLKPEQWDFFHVAKTKINDEEIYVAKLCVPSHQIGTYLNKIINIWKINLNDLIVIHDDDNIDFGRVILSRSGNGGNHTAATSIICALGTSNFNRLRIGIGHKKGVPRRKYLLGEYTDKQFNKLSKIFTEATDIIEEIIKKSRKSQEKNI